MSESKVKGSPPSPVKEFPKASLPGKAQPKDRSAGAKKIPAYPTMKGL